MKRIIIDFLRRIFNCNIYNLNGICEIYYDKKYKEWMFFFRSFSHTAYYKILSRAPCAIQ